MQQLIQSTVPHFRDRTNERLHISDKKFLKEINRFITNDKCNTSHFILDEGTENIYHYFNINELPSYKHINQYVKIVYNAKRRVYITLMTISDFYYRQQFDLYMSKMLHKHFYNKCDEVEIPQEKIDIKTSEKFSINDINLFEKEAIDFIKSGVICKFGYVKRESSRKSKFYFNINILNSFKHIDQYLEVNYYSNKGIVGIELISKEKFDLLK